MRTDKYRSSKFTRVEKLKLRNRKIRLITIGAVVFTIILWSSQLDVTEKPNTIVNTPVASINKEIVIPIKTDVGLEPIDIINNETIIEKEPPIDNEKIIEVISNEGEIETCDEAIHKEEPSFDIVEEIDSEEIIEEETPIDTIDGPQPKKMIALSYDDGPSKTLTLELLEILQEHDSTATFFVLGNKVKQYSDIIYELHNAGNEIGNHGYDHSDLSKLTEEQITEQFLKTEEAIYEVINEYPTFFRPPYGSLNEQVKNSIESPLILWSIDSNDWRSISDEQVINNVISVLDDGKIILMHDIHRRTIEVSKILIPMIKELGYEIVSIEELFETYQIELEDGKVYTKVKKN